MGAAYDVLNRCYNTNFKTSCVTDIFSEKTMLKIKLYSILSYEQSEVYSHTLGKYFNCLYEEVCVLRK